MNYSSAATDYVIEARKLKEGNEVYNGVRYLILEDVVVSDYGTTLEADGCRWTVDHSQMMHVASY